jgi:hypothetical protein
MFGNRDIGRHPRMDFAANLDDAGRNERLADNSPRVKPDIELRLFVREKSMGCVKDGIRVFDHHELPDARRLHMRAEATLYVI